MTDKVNLVDIDLSKVTDRRDISCKNIKNIEDSKTKANIIRVMSDSVHSFERGQYQNRESSDKECDGSDKESSTSNELGEGNHDHELELINENVNIDISETSETSVITIRSDVATVGSNDSAESSESSISTILDSSLPVYIHSVEKAHDKIGFQIDETYSNLISDINLQSENITKHQREKECSKTEEETEEETEKEADKFKDIEKKQDTESIEQEFDETNESMQMNIDQDDQIEDAGSIMESLSSVTRDINSMNDEIRINVKDLQELISNVPGLFNSINEKVRKNEETIQLKFDEKVAQLRDEMRGVILKCTKNENRLSFVENLREEFKDQELTDLILRLQNKKSQELDDKILRFQDQTAQDLSNKISKLRDQSNEEFDDKISKLQDQKSRELDDKILKFQDQTTQDLSDRILKLQDQTTQDLSDKILKIQDKSNEELCDKISKLQNKSNEELNDKILKFEDQKDQKDKELDDKILKIQFKSNELESKTNELEVSLRDKLEELEREISTINTESHKKIAETINKSDSLMTLLEDTKSELQNCFQKEIRESENDTFKRLEEDRTKKLAIMTAAVEEEARKIYGRLETVESCYGALQKEFKECDSEIIKRLEETDQIIRESIRKAIDLYTTEYDAKVAQRIHEAIESYEERVNKLADVSFELEATFNEEIQKTAERKIRAIEEENRKLKEHKRELKSKLEAKELECSDYKYECDHSDEIITTLGEDKAELENKVHKLKNERNSLEINVKEMEERIREMEKVYRANLAESNEEIESMKVDIGILDQRAKAAEANRIWCKGWLDISLAIITVLFIANIYLLVSPLDNSWYFIANFGPAPQ